jgi:hypothetical protein
MKSKWVVLGTLVLVLTGLANGCVDNDRSLMIVFNVGPTEDCEYKVQESGTSQIYVPTGFLDLSLNNVYWLEPQIENYMPNNYNMGTKDLNSMTVQLEGAEVTYTWLAGRDIIEAYPTLLALENADPYIYYFNSVVSASSQSEPGKTLAEIGLFSGEVGDLIATNMGSSADLRQVALGARVRVFGHTLGGTSVRSNEFVYPVYFCYQCINIYCCPGTTDLTLREFCILGQPYHKTCSCT